MVTRLFLCISIPSHISEDITLGEPFCLAVPSLMFVYWVLDNGDIQWLKMTWNQLQWYLSSAVIQWSLSFLSFLAGRGVTIDKSYGNLSWMKDKVGNQCKFQIITVCKVMALAVSDVLTMLKNLNTFWIRGSRGTCSHFILFWTLHYYGKSITSQDLV